MIAPMAEWRLGRGWSERELKSRLDKAKLVKRNFPDTGPESQAGTNWRRYYSESIIAREAAGPPIKDGAFELAWKAVSEYQFSDPGIVTGHFSPKDPLDQRTMLLEIKVLGLRYLCGVRVGDTYFKNDPDETQYGWRYDTLEGHFEVGSEWFLVTKKHATGEVWFRISASWRPGVFPNWWSRAGFEFLGRNYQLAWHRLAYVRLRELVGHGGVDLVPIPHGEDLVHTGAEITNSDLWILSGSSVATRVSQAGKGVDACPQIEEDKSSLLPGPHQASDGPPPSASPPPKRA